MSAQDNGYLMDLEFYPSDMALGGLEFAIVQIIRVLAAEGCDVLSLGGTYGCKLASSANADAAIDRILDDLREQKIFNDEGNLQFKNKFRPENKPVFLCRPVGGANPGTVLDVIMMIADPEEVRAFDEEEPVPALARSEAAPPREEPPAPLEPSAPELSFASRQVSVQPLEMERRERAIILAQFGFNPLKIPAENICFDLKTDSWAQLEMPAIQAHMSRLQAQLQVRGSVDESLRRVFPFAHILLTGSGEEAEHFFFSAFSSKGTVLQNLLFPSTLSHEIAEGFHPREMPHPGVFRLTSQEPYKGNMACDMLKNALQQDPDGVALVCIEVSNNAAGGCPVSLQHLSEVKALLAGHAIPLVLDCTRILENAQMLIEGDKDCAGKSVWTVARELCSYADALFGSLTKDFCVTRGGIIAAQDDALFRKLQELVEREGSGIDLIDQRMVALALQNRKQIETSVLGRMEAVRRIWKALKKQNVPVVEPAGGHCVLIDVKGIPAFASFSDPVPSFLAWLYESTGIRAAAHSVGMQKGTALNGLVRLAIPIGLSSAQVDDVAGRLAQTFANIVNIPEVAAAGGAKVRETSTGITNYSDMPVPT